MHTIANPDQDAMHQNYTTQIQGHQPLVGNVVSQAGIDDRGLTLEEWADRDRASSAIPQALWDENIATFTGQGAVEYLLGDALDQMPGHGQQYATKPVADLLNKYQHIEAGGWGTRDGVAYFKPWQPRLNPSKPGRCIKYETPPRAIAAPFVPRLDEATAARFGVAPGASVLDIANANPAQPVAIVEGVKKSLALLAHGVLAIAIRGVTQWHLKGCTDELHPELAEIATPERRLYIVFDEDTNPRTISNVWAQLEKLAKVLSDRGCDVRVPRWDNRLGKGVDDVLFAMPDAQNWLDALLASVSTFHNIATHLKCAPQSVVIESLRSMITEGLPDSQVQAKLTQLSRDFGHSVQTLQRIYAALGEELDLITPDQATFDELAAATHDHYDIVPLLATLAPVIGKYAKAFNQDAVAFTIPLLGTAASLLNPATELVIGGPTHYRVRPIFWGGIVAEPGSIKSPIFNMALRPLHLLQASAHDAYTEALNQYKHDLRVWKNEGGDGDEPVPPDYRHYYADSATVEAIQRIVTDQTDHGIVVAPDELTSLFNGFNQYKGGRGSDVDFWKSAADGAAARPWRTLAVNVDLKDVECDAGSS